MINDNHSGKINYEEHLSPHFTLGEMLRSGVAITHRIKNEPGVDDSPFGYGAEEVKDNLRALCTSVLEPLRRRVGRVVVVSGYRCEALNRLVSGADNSQHMKGEAVDIHVTGQKMCRKYGAILSTTDFDQIIFEPQESAVKRWIHVSHKRNGRNRHQILGQF